MNLLCASNNENKIIEIRQKLPQNFTISGLKELGIIEDIPETADSLEGNAIQKVEYLYNLKGVNCFADDTGLEVYALGGEPGVYSARFAGPQRNSTHNMNLLLDKLQGFENRKARFRTVVALIFNGEQHLFEGIVEGEIIKEMVGGKGFGYDPVFQPDGHEITFAEMSVLEKNKISHRARAINSLVDFLVKKSK
ncbi:MAG: XTP/dITP diphosphohydrolase [Ulvibacter sp.]|jgi:XTP/dITP diphosphohydrolase